MNKNEYLKKFKKELKGLPRAAREEIVREMQGNLDDFNDTEHSLEAHFGTPRQLAQNYLQDIDTTPTAFGKISSLLGKLMAGVGWAFLLLIALGLILGWVAWRHFKGDRYDYADVGMALHYFGEEAWTQQDVGGVLRLESKQSEVVVYWHDKPHLTYQCRGKGVSGTAAILTIEQSFCVIFLPPPDGGRAATLDVDLLQSDFTVVRPQTPLAVKTMQSSVRVAEGGNRYRYQIKNNQSKVTGLSSHADAAVTVRIDAYQSNIRDYQYQ